MPHIVFTAAEVFDAALEDMRQTSVKLLELADLDVKPLNPGESPGDQYHKIAKLGKQLAESFIVLNRLVTATTAHAVAAIAAPDPTKPSDTSN